MLGELKGLNNIKKNFPYVIDFIDKYFIIYKKPFFENGEYNYNDIPIDCRANSYLENYNLFLKKQLGRKYKLNWDLFINFIKKEFIRIRDRLTENTEKNIKIISKKTKFGSEKYTQNTFNNNKLNKCYDKEYYRITNYKWLNYSNNSCRYDVFSSLYVFCIYDFIEENYNKFNKILQCTHDFMKNIKNNPSEYNRKSIWDFFIKMQIDVFSTQINDKNKIIDTGFGKSGFIVQLFQIFKNNYYFCLKERRSEKCEICSYIKNFPDTLHDHIIVCNEFNINFNSIENIISYSLIFDGLIKCDNCNFSENILTSRIFYNITGYPNFLFILFDFSSYNNLLLYIYKIKALLVEYIEFTSNDKFILKGFIASPYNNHFTLFINKLNIKNILPELNLNKCYYYDDLMFENKFVEIDNLECLFNKIKFGFTIVPYLALYEKVI